MKRGMMEVGHAGMGRGVRSSRLGIWGWWQRSGNWALPSSDHLCNFHHEPPHDP